MSHCRRGETVATGQALVTNGHLAVQKFGAEHSVFVRHVIYGKYAARLSPQSRLFHEVKCWGINVLFTLFRVTSPDLFLASWNHMII